MEDALDAGAGRIDGAHVGDVGLDHLEPRIAFMLLQIGSAADDEVVEHTHPPALGHQAIDEMTADEARPSRNEVRAGASTQEKCPHRLLLLTTSSKAALRCNIIFGVRADCAARTTALSSHLEPFAPRSVLAAVLLRNAVAGTARQWQV